MSADLLRHLADRYTFDAAPPFADLGAYHVPFDELIGGSAVERRLLDAAVRGERVALVGAGGSGKSSIVAHVLGPIAERVAPIVVPVRGISPDGGVSPSRVADEVLALLRTYADEVPALGRAERDRIAAALGPSRRVTRAHGRSSGVTLAIGWLHGELGRDISRQVEHDEQVTLREKSEVLHQVFATIASEGLRPVLVFDDSDRWIRSTDRDVMARFFGEVVRWLSDLSASVVVAVHDRYFEHLPRNEILQFLDTRVTVPRLTEVGQLAAIIGHRVTSNVADTPYDGAVWDDVFDHAAVASLFEAYAGGSSLREAVQLCHVALTEAVERSGATVVTAGDVDGALSAG